MSYNRLNHSWMAKNYIMGFLKKWSTAITGGKKGIVTSHVMNNLDSLEEMLGKQRVLKFHLHFLRH